MLRWEKQTKPSNINAISCWKKQKYSCVNAWKKGSRCCVSFLKIRFALLMRFQFSGVNLWFFSLAFFLCIWIAVWLFYKCAFITGAMQQLYLLESLHFGTIMYYDRILAITQVTVSVPVADFSWLIMFSFSWIRFCPSRLAVKR